MQKLHMVGFTTDHRGLILSVRRGAKSGRYVVDLDDALLGAVEEVRAELAEEASKASEADATRTRPESALSVREIQTRLRRGRTIDQVAREAGVDASWIARFAAPVLTEQAEVIRTTRATHMTKQRVGLSGLALGDAVYRNLADRGVTDPRDALDRAWRAKQLTEGMWLVSFTYVHRGRQNTATWEYDETNGAVRPRGRVATSLGYREPVRRAAPAEKAATNPRPSSRPAKKTAKKSTKKATKSTARSSTKKAGAKKTAGKQAVARRAAAPTTARQSPSRQASKRVAAARRAAAARMVSEAQKATRRDAALARKAATRPVVIRPRSEEPVVGALTPEPRFDVVRAIDVHAPEPAPDLTPGPEPVVEPEPLFDDVGAEAELEVEDEELFVDHEPDSEDLTGDEPEPEVEEAEEVEDAEEEKAEDPGPAVEATIDESVLRPRRREPLRAPRLADITIDSNDANGPVFRGDLAQPASDGPVPPRAAVGQSPDVPLSMPIEPIEPPPRRRRLRPLRGR